MARKLKAVGEGDIMNDIIENDEGEHTVHVEHIEPAPVGAVTSKLSAIMSDVDALRTEAVDRVHTLSAQLAEAQNELALINNLIAFKRGGNAPSRGPVMARTRKEEPGSRAPRGFWKDKLILTLKDTDGMSRSEIIGALEIKDDQKAQASISNMLMVMKKNNELTHDNGVYKLVD